MHMNESKLNKKAIIDIFDLGHSGLFDITKAKPGPVNMEEVSGHDVDTLIDILCAGHDDVIRFYSNFVKAWGVPEDDYEILMSNGEDDNELMLSTVLDNDTVVISRDDHFTSMDLFNILSTINSQLHFNDLYVLIQKDSNTIDYSGTAYSGESFAIHKDWIGDLMELFRAGEFDCFRTVTITSDFDELDLEPADGVVSANRLYVMFNLNY